jgi:hypothetical protein
MVTIKIIVLYILLILLFKVFLFALVLDSFLHGLFGMIDSVSDTIFWNMITFIMGVVIGLSVIYIYEIWFKMPQECKKSAFIIFSEMCTQKERLSYLLDILQSELQESRAEAVRSDLWKLKHYRPIDKNALSLSLSNCLLLDDDIYKKLSGIVKLGDRLESQYLSICEYLDSLHWFSLDPRKYPNSKDTSWGGINPFFTTLAFFSLFEDLLNTLKEIISLQVLLKNKFLDIDVDINELNFEIKVILREIEQWRINREELEPIIMASRNLILGKLLLKFANL